MSECKQKESHFPVTVDPQCTVTNLYIPVTVRYTENNIDITRLYHSEHSLPVARSFVKLRFHYV